MTYQWANVCHNVVAMRAAPDGGSEQISQAILGDSAEIIDAQPEYARVRVQDGYEGWILHRHLEMCDERDLYSAPDSNVSVYFIATPFADLYCERGSLLTRLVFGTKVRIGQYELPSLINPNISPPQMSGQRDKRPIQDGQDVAAVCGRVEVHFPGGLSGCLDSNSLRSLDAALDTRSAICPTALSFLGTPYLWGGTTPFGFDCSGLVQRAYSAAGIVLPRDAYQQAASPLGKPVPIGAALEPRDLVFFRGARDPLNRGITHVGMMIDGTRMIHASGRTGVVVQELTDGEILESHTYRGAWRLI